jgi:hypothetical protein
MKKENQPISPAGQALAMDGRCKPQDALRWQWHRQRSSNQAGPTADEESPRTEEGGRMIFSLGPGSVIADQVGLAAVTPQPQSAHGARFKSHPPLPYVPRPFRSAPAF